MSIVVAAKLNDKASVRLLQFVLKHLGDGDRSMLHLVVVVLQKSSRSEERREAQDLVRQQFGSLLPKSWPHKLHIVRLLTNGQGPQTAELSGFMARAICSKAAALACDVIVLGGKARRSPCGTVRNSAVSEAVRKHSRRPVLLIADEHPLLCQTLPAIAEEEAADEDLSDEELDSQALLCSPKPVGAAADRILAGQLLASIGHTDAAHLTPSTLGPETAPAAQASTLSVAAC